MSPKKDRTTCKALGKSGKPCKRSPMKGSDYCNTIGHDPNASPSVGFGSRAQASAAGKLGGRPPLPKPTDVARQLIEENVTRILRPHFLALGMDLAGDGSVQIVPGAVMVGESKDGDMIASDIEDLGAQIAAAEKLLDRVYGKPKQATEISGPDGGPVKTVDLGRLDTSELEKLAELTAKAESA